MFAVHVTDSEEWKGCISARAPKFGRSNQIAPRCVLQWARSEIEEKLKAICDAALPGKRVDINDNLFELGASSLKLIEIHEQIDREYPGKVDLTELFDFPTIAELAQHLQGKLT